MVDCNLRVGQKASWEAKEEVQAHDHQFFYSPPWGHKRQKYKELKRAGIPVTQRTTSHGCTNETAEITLFGELHLTHNM